MIVDVAYSAPTYDVLCAKYGRARGVIQRWLNDPRVKEAIRLRREEYEVELKSTMQRLQDLSLARTEEILSKPADGPQAQAVQARLALAVLQGRGHLVEKQEVEHTGGGMVVYLPRKVPVGQRADGGNDIEDEVAAAAEAGDSPVPEGG